MDPILGTVPTQVFHDPTVRSIPGQSTPGSELGSYLRSLATSLGRFWSPILRPPSTSTSPPPSQVSSWSGQVEGPGHGVDMDPDLDASGVWTKRDVAVGSGPVSPLGMEGVWDVETFAYPGGETGGFAWGGCLHHLAKIGGPIFEASGSFQFSKN